MHALHVVWPWRLRCRIHASNPPDDCAPTPQGCEDRSIFRRAYHSVHWPSRPCGKVHHRIYVAPHTAAPRSPFLGLSTKRIHEVPCSFYGITPLIWGLRCQEQKRGHKHLFLAFFVQRSELRQRSSFCSAPLGAHPSVPTRGFSGPSRTGAVKDGRCPSGSARTTSSGHSLTGPSKTANSVASGGGLKPLTFRFPVYPL